MGAAPREYRLLREDVTGVCRVTGAYRVTGRVAALTFDQVTRLLNEQGIAARVLWESFLLPHLGVRPAGMVVLPVEFPDFHQIGHSIGRVISERLHLGFDHDSPALKAAGDKIRFTFYRLALPARRYRSLLVESSFNDVLHDSSSYQAHLSWARTLGLTTFEIGVRANIRELFLFSSASARRNLTRLTATREKVRRRLGGRLDGTQARSYMVYPEELSPLYMESMGAELGYPSCCVRAYVADRIGEVFYPEVRAEEQLRGSEVAGPVEPYAYFVRHFVPCSPQCPEAVAHGRRAAAALEAADSRLGRAYLGGLERNREAIRRAPALIARREQEIATHLRGGAGDLPEAVDGPGEDEP
jgi:hypothetical protein